MIVSGASVSSDGIGAVPDDVSSLEKAQGKVAVLRKRVGGKPADVADRVSAEGADGTGDDRQWRSRSQKRGGRNSGS